MASTKVIGFVGQSNEVAQGLGTFSENAGTGNDYRIYQIGRAPYHTDKAVVLAAEPLDHVWPANKHGSGMETLRYFARKPGNLAAGDTVLAVPGARGGTTILFWNGVEPYIDPLTNQAFDLNGDFMARMDIAMAQPGAALAFIRWTQSESDIRRIAGDPYDANMLTAADYVTQFQTLVATWRNRYGVMPIIWTPPTPGLAVKQPDLESAENALVTAMQALVGTLPHFAIVDTHDLKDNSSVTGNPADAIHYNAEAQEFIALRTVYTAYPAALLA